MSIKAPVRPEPVKGLDSFAICRVLPSVCGVRCVALFQSGENVVHKRSRRLRRQLDRYARAKPLVRVHEVDVQRVVGRHVVRVVVIDPSLRYRNPARRPLAAARNIRFLYHVCAHASILLSACSAVVIGMVGQRLLSACGCVNAAGLLFPDLVQASHRIVHLRVNRADTGRLGRFEQFGIGGTMKTREKEAAMSNAVAR